MNRGARTWGKQAPQARTQIISARAPNVEHKSAPMRNHSVNALRHDLFMGTVHLSEG